jgi:hypothetical protein
MGGDHRSRLSGHREAVLTLVAHRSDLTLAEIRAELAARHGIRAGCEWKNGMNGHLSVERVDWWIGEGGKGPWGAILDIAKARTSDHILPLATRSSVGQTTIWRFFERHKITVKKKPARRRAGAA